MGVYINGQIFGNKCFPNNERVFEAVALEPDLNIIKVEYETDIDIVSLMFAKYYIQDNARSSLTVLDIPYFPYERMDREINNEKEQSIFSLKYFADFIDYLTFDLIIVRDPHSKVVGDYVGNLLTVFPTETVYRLFESEKFDYVFLPDEGAVKRYKNWYANFPIFRGTKTRVGGEITGFELVDPPDLKDKKILIVDDLCSKGGTFLASAKQLKEHGAKEVSMFVTHCEPTVFKGSLLNSPLISKLYTTDTLIKGHIHKKIEVLPFPSTEFFIKEWFAMQKKESNV